MVKKVISLSVEEEINNKYKTICEKKGWIISKQFENFIREELKKNNRGR